MYLFLDSNLFLPTKIIFTLIKIILIMLILVVFILAIIIVAVFNLAALISNITMSVIWIQMLLDLLFETNL